MLLQVLIFFARLGFKIVAKWIKRPFANLKVKRCTGLSPTVDNPEQEVKFLSMNHLFLGCLGVSRGPTITPH